MTVDEQQKAYDGKTEVTSDPFGLIGRDNRNHRRKLELILEHTRAETGDRVLEVGCGHGLHATGYAERFEYTGIDLSESLVRSTKTRLPDDADVLPMDAMDLSFADGAFDSVVGSAILHHIPEPRKALSEWIRVTKSGGSVTLIEPNYLFPLAFASAHLVDEEQHKTEMAPWRVQQMLDDVANSYRHEPCVYTPPWPAAADSLYARLDSLGTRVPGVRWLSQLQLIHVEVEA